MCMYIHAHREENRYITKAVMTEPSFFLLLQFEKEYGDVRKSIGFDYFAETKRRTICLLCLFDVLVTRINVTMMKRPFGQ